MTWWRLCWIQSIIDRPKILPKVIRVLKHKTEKERERESKRGQHENDVKSNKNQAMIFKPDAMYVLFPASQPTPSIFTSPSYVICYCVCVCGMWDYVKSKYLNKIIDGSIITNDFHIGKALKNMWQSERWEKTIKFPYHRIFVNFSLLLVDRLTFSFSVRYIRIVLRNIVFISK